MACLSVVNYPGHMDPFSHADNISRLKFTLRPSPTILHCHLFTEEADVDHRGLSNVR